MCGFIGSINFSHDENIKALSLIDHRGPDDTGFYEESGFFLGHKRLAIVDTSLAGHQPMFSEDGEIVIVFNGEIYNHIDIRDMLKQKYIFKSNSDTETILNGFLEFGIDLFDMLNGIFSFTIFNLNTKDLYLVRDHYGVKPLYYYNNNEQWLFGSEIKSMVQYSDFKSDLSVEGLVNYINFLWSPGEVTPFLNVKKLLPGHYIKLNVNAPKEFAICKYYDISFTGKYLLNTEEELIDMLDQKMECAVSRQLMSDVPVGFFLSGGLDSSLIVAYAKKLRATEEIHCFTINGGEGNVDEGFADDLKYARQVANYLDVKLHVVNADIDIVRDFDKMIYHLDEPQADPAPLNVLNISKEAIRHGFKVLLGGTAGDDLFSGYRRHQVLSFEKYYRLIPPSFGKMIKLGISIFSSHNPTFRRLKKAAENLDKTKLSRMAGYFSWIPLETNKSLFSETNQQKLKGYNPNDYLIQLLNNIPNEKSDLNRMLYWECKSFLVDHNLNYTDKMSMAVGLEARVPFLDRELVDFSVLIPPSLKLKGVTTKYLLKKVAERYLPNEVIYRPKTGFGAPIRKWILEDMAEMIEHRLSPNNIKKNGLFNSEKVQELIIKNKSGEIDASYTIWSLLAIDSWYNQFYKKNN